MRYIEWLFLFVLSGLGIALANFVGFNVGFMDSLPGILILLAISAAGVIVSKIVPLKLPIVAYVSIIGLLTACPISPCREFVIEAANKINFTAPLTMVGAYAGISISGQIKSFLKQGLENDCYRRICHDRNIYLLCVDRSNCAVNYRCYLGGNLCVN